MGKELIYKGVEWPNHEPTVVAGEIFPIHGELLRQVVELGMPIVNGPSRGEIGLLAIPAPSMKDRHWLIKEKQAFEFIPAEETVVSAKRRFEKSLE
jgi:hypothetical protein